MLSLSFASALESALFATRLVENAQFELRERLEECTFATPLVENAQFEFRERLRERTFSDTSRRKCSV